MVAMAEVTLNELLERNDRHVRSLPDGYFREVIDTQRPAAVSICCADSRVPQAGMWDVDRPGWLFTPSTIGNQVWDHVDGDLVVDGSLVYPLRHTDTAVAVIVGHTGCGAVAAALARVQSGKTDLEPGVEKWVEMLVPVVRDGLDDDRISPDASAPLIDQLVEYNVDRQVEFLREDDIIGPEKSVYGFIYDFMGTYGKDPGRAYLVNANGNTEEDDLRSQVDDAYEHSVVRLL